MNFQKLCVLGLGYIGLPTASTFATYGLQVVGVDINPQVVQTLQNGQVHIYEPGLRTVVQAALRSGNLRIEPRPEEADAFIIAVPTPFQKDKRADLSYVTAASQDIVPYLRKGCLVVLESTSPPRTTIDIVAPILERSGLKAGYDFHLAYTPERVLPGQILRELIENARVIGGVSPESAQAGRDLYSIFVRGEIILTDSTTAEMVKLMENTYRDVNIAIANEFSRLADRFGIDIWEAIDIANRHPRVRILKPGPGVGGHCISVDPWFLVEAAPDLSPLIRTARQVNDAQPHFMLDLAQRALDGKLRNRRIAILGLAYKPDVDDLRESPALEVAKLLVAAGAQVTAFEPYISSAIQEDTPVAAHQRAALAALTDIQIGRTLEETVHQAELLLLLVAHSPFRSLQPAILAGQTPARLIIDATGSWSEDTWRSAGFTIYRLSVNRMKNR